MTERGTCCEIDAARHSMYAKPTEYMDEPLSMSLTRLVIYRYGPLATGGTDGCEEQEVCGTRALGTEKKKQRLHVA